MRFTVLIATRNRPGLVRQAIDSVLRQSLPDWDMVVVNDGSDAQHLPALAELDRLLGPRGRRIDLVPRARGHGPSYALNAGAAVAGGDYLCFLDDDDEWTDSGHLARVARAIDGEPAPPDLVLANQRAYVDGAAMPQPIWIEDVLERAPRPLAPRATGAYPVTPADLLRGTGFAHVNTITIRRALYERLGGFDDSIIYEGDRDFYLRAIDAAASILYLPEVMARHNVPNRAARSNASTSLSDTDKYLFRLRLLDKAILSSRHAAVRRHAMRHKQFTLQRIAGELRRAGDDAAALFYAREALGIGLDPRWGIQVLGLALRRALRREAQDPAPPPGSR